MMTRKSPRISGKHEVSTGVETEEAGRKTCSCYETPGARFRCLPHGGTEAADSRSCGRKLLDEVFDDSDNFSFEVAKGLVPSNIQVDAHFVVT